MKQSTCTSHLVQDGNIGTLIILCENFNKMLAARIFRDVNPPSLQTFANIGVSD